MQKRIACILSGLVLGLLACAGSATAQQRPEVTKDDAVVMPGQTVPYSAFASAASRAQFRHMLENSRHAPPLNGPIKASRDFYARINGDRARRMEKIYPVHIQHTSIAGVAADVVTPAKGIAAGQRHRVLVNLHGGAFLWGAKYGGLVEAVPVAALGRIKVITVYYRQGPEHVFPAASEDVEAVYRALLKAYPAANIGIYGCSAGGILTAEATARLIVHKLPVPGAIGTFCGSIADLDGDSAYVAPTLDGDPPPQQPLALQALPYFKGANADDPMVFPANSPRLLKHFPPTLLITGTRDFTMSSVIYSSNLLRQAGVDAELHIWNGMWHSFFSDPEMPESRQAYATMVGFFDRHLGR